MSKCLLKRFGRFSPLECAKNRQTAFFKRPDARVSWAGEQGGKGAARTQSRCEFNEDWSWPSYRLAGACACPRWDRSGRRRTRRISRTRRTSLEMKSVVLRLSELCESSHANLFTFHRFAGARVCDRQQVRRCFCVKNSRWFIYFSTHELRQANGRHLLRFCRWRSGCRRASLPFRPIDEQFAAVAASAGARAPRICPAPR